MAKVVSHLGYEIDGTPSINHAGSEIDIEGHLKLANTPLYAECKFYDRDVDSPKLQQFLGKFLPRWLRNNRSHGLFIAIPGINSHARGFFRDEIESRTELTVRLLEEEKVLDIIFETNRCSPATVFANRVATFGKPGDWMIALTEDCLYFVQFVIPSGAGVATDYVVFNAHAEYITKRDELELIQIGIPELTGFSCKSPDETREFESNQDIGVDEIVEVQASSAWFEYQFPAAPEFFIGRDEPLARVTDVVKSVLARNTSARGIAFEANSGWGKSSLVLSAAENLRNAGHFAVAIDCRSASSTQFVLRAVDYAIRKWHHESGLFAPVENLLPISGLEGATRALVELGSKITSSHQLFVIFFDQFENLFYRPDILRTIRDLFLAVSARQENVILGFSWKTDLIGLTNEFPYQMRDCLRDGSIRISLDRFLESDTNRLLDQLSHELRAALRKDLRFLLSELSQGYPWLLKKLCAHVKTQRDSGVMQRQIAAGFLKIEELFEDDLRGLDSTQEEAVRRLAQIVPVSVNELESSEVFQPEILQSLVDRRLLVRIGAKYDLYWDIFRDYLTTGTLPAQAHYILRMQPGGVVRAVKKLANMGGRASLEEFKRTAGRTQASFHNVMRDMKLLGLVQVENEGVSLRMNASGTDLEFEDCIRPHVRDVLLQNRLVQNVLSSLEDNGTIDATGITNLLRESCPYISATPSTWQTYGKVLSAWLDFSELAFLQPRSNELSPAVPGQEIRERRVVAHGRRSSNLIGTVQYGPIERALERTVAATRNKLGIDWSDFSPSTRSKVLVSLVELGFIQHDGNRILVESVAIEFADNPERRPVLFAKCALRLSGFRTFVSVLEKHAERRCSHETLGSELSSALGVDWKPATAQVNVKIMLNWARHAGLAPTVYQTVSASSTR